jgi:hypothetical protein
LIKFKNGVKNFEFKEDRHLYLNSYSNVFNSNNDLLFNELLDSTKMFSELDYVKMYLANVYGKNRISRQEKIN